MFKIKADYDLRQILLLDLLVAVAGILVGQVSILGHENMRLALSFYMASAICTTGVAQQIPSLRPLRPAFVVLTVFAVLLFASNLSSHLHSWLQVPIGILFAVEQFSAWIAVLVAPNFRPVALRLAILVGLSVGTVYISVYRGH